MTSKLLVAAGSRSNTALRSCRIALNMLAILRWSRRLNQTDGMGDHTFFLADRVEALSTFYFYVDLIGIAARRLRHFFLHGRQVRPQARGLRHDDRIDVAHSVALRLQLGHDVFQQL